MKKAACKVPEPAVRDRTLATQTHRTKEKRGGGGRHQHHASQRTPAAPLSDAGVWSKSKRLDPARWIGGSCIFFFRASLSSHRQKQLTSAGCREAIQHEIQYEILTLNHPRCVISERASTKAWESAEPVERSCCAADPSGFDRERSSAQGKGRRRMADRGRRAEKEGRARMANAVGCMLHSTRGHQKCQASGRLQAARQWVASVVRSPAWWCITLNILASGNTPSAISTVMPLRCKIHVTPLAVPCVRLP